jgi:hypothetical protein
LTIFAVISVYYVSNSHLTLGHTVALAGSVPFIIPPMQHKKKINQPYVKLKLISVHLFIVTFYSWQ